jgi:hypothetical protein
MMDNKGCLESSCANPKLKTRSRSIDANSQRTILIEMPEVICAKHSPAK